MRFPGLREDSPTSREGENFSNVRTCIHTYIHQLLAIAGTISRKMSGRVFSSYRVVYVVNAVKSWIVSILFLAMKFFLDFSILLLHCSTAL